MGWVLFGFWLIVTIIIAWAAVSQTYSEYVDPADQRIFARIALASWTWPVTLPIAIFVAFCALVWSLIGKAMGPRKTAVQDTAESE